MRGRPACSGNSKEKNHLGTETKRSSKGKFVNRDKQQNSSDNGLNKNNESKKSVAKNGNSNKSKKGNISNNYLLIKNLS